MLIIGDVQHLYINRRHRYADQSATTPYEPFKTFSGNYHAVSDALKQNGTTHIVYNPEELRRLQRMGIVAWKREDIPLIEGFLTSPYGQELYVNKGQGMDVKVYKLI